MKGVFIKLLLLLVFSGFSIQASVFSSAKDYGYFQRLKIDKSLLKRYQGTLCIIDEELEILIPVRGMIEDDEGCFIEIDKNGFYWDMKEIDTRKIWHSYKPQHISKR